MMPVMISEIATKCFLNRAHAYIKSDKFEQAKEDADKVWKHNHC